MPVRARRFIRKMRGGAQAHLVEAEDGHFYVLKFRNNPQHRRVLVNELISAMFLSYLRIPTPEIRIVLVDQEFLGENPEVFIQLGSRRVPIEPGPHFGSRFPGDPNGLAVYDFLPDLLLPKVANLREFLGALVFDKWAGNADSRQSIFYRARIRTPGMGDQEHVAFVALMMDHGYMFDGPNWRFADSPLTGLYHRPLVYEHVRSVEDFQPWLGLVENFPEEVIDSAWKQVPGDWLDGDEEELEQLLERLLHRRSRVAALIQDCALSRIRPFPNWR